MHDLVMATGMVKDLQSELTCPLCLDIFADPKRLPCEHVYCRRCLHGLAQRSTTGRISCPECRSSVALPGNSVDNFPTPHQVNRLIDMYRKNLGTAKSAECVTCQVHDSQPLDLYCETCSKLVCRDCTILDCAKMNHAFGFMDDMIKKHRTDLDKEIEPVKQLRERMVAALGSIAAAEEEVEGEKETKLQDVETAFNAFHEILDHDKKSLTESIQRSFQKLKDSNSSKRNEIIEAMEELTDSIETLSQQEPDSAFLKNFSEKKLRIGNLHGHYKNLTLQPATVPEMKVEFLNPSDLKDFFQGKNFAYHKGDVFKGHIQTSLDLKNIQMLKLSKVSLQLHTHGIKKSKSYLSFIAAIVIWCRGLM